MKIKQFVEGKKIDDFKLTISSGESQVPNPKGFEQKGSLARKRAEVLKGYLDTALPNLLNGMKPVVEILQPTVGRTEWNPNTDKKDDPKYTAEQFVNVNVVFAPLWTTEVVRVRGFVVLPTSNVPPDIAMLLAFTAPSGVTLNGALLSELLAVVEPAQNE